jgi:GTP pyrophosphokinase/guanosine-3',5'-bis(diphosphate) 3'-pyrophosphohydrolase
LIGEASANISDLEFVERKPDFYRLVVYVDLRDVSHLHSLMSTIEAESEVADVSRHRNMSMGKTVEKTD